MKKFLKGLLIVVIILIIVVVGIMMGLWYFDTHNTSGDFAKLIYDDLSHNKCNDIIDLIPENRLEDKTKEDIEEFLSPFYGESVEDWDGISKVIIGPQKIYEVDYDIFDKPSGNIMEKYNYPSNYKLYWESCEIKVGDLYIWGVKYITGWKIINAYYYDDNGDYYEL